MTNQTIYASYCPFPGTATNKGKSMKYKFTGTLAEIGDIETFQSGFQKRSFVVDDGRDRANPVPFQLTKDNCTKLDQFKIGDRVEVEYFMNGRRWDGPNGTKYFLDLSAMEIRLAQAYGSTAPAARPAPAAAAPAAPVWVETATKKDVFAAYMRRYHIGQDEMVKQLNDRNSPFTQLRMKLNPGLAWGKYVDNSPECAKIVNELTGAKPDRPEEAYAEVANDPDDLPF